ncbi:hypothetical protein ACMFMF_006297 [Clarireedia jacksonii]
MASTRFSRLFDGWDRDHQDLSMVELEVGHSPPRYASQDHDTEYRSPSSPDNSSSPRNSVSRRNSADLSQRPSPLPGASESISIYEDGTSTRRLLQERTSFASSFGRGSTNDYQALKSGTESVKGEARQRNRLGGNVKRIWSKGTAFTKGTPSTFDGHFAHGKDGWWKKQMLVDRSLRTMAGLTFLSAMIMLIIIIAYLPSFTRRLNKHSTSVGGKEGESCSSMESRNIAVHLFINIVATMILGCSNTYQQLVTAPKVEEIPWILSKKGDCKVGTNSPWNINVKKTGKTKAWLSWALLISTSIPIHFLANSVIGPSFYVESPTNVTFNMNETLERGYYSYGSHYYGSYQVSSYDFSCWSAFRTGLYVFPNNISQLSSDYNSDTLGNSTSFKSVIVQYDKNCTEYRETGTVEQAVREINYTGYSYHGRYQAGNCILGAGVYCELLDQEPKKCRLNVRMQAAFTLFGCLLIKAAYMIALNWKARHRTKTACLTYGDVIVASVIDPSLKIHNECLLNSGDGYRHKTIHTCHKHCTDPIPSTSGDDIGHCQKCKKFNDVDKAADLPHPSIAIKYKRSLLSNLGSTAITQMIILMFCSIVLVAISIMLITFMVSTSSQYKHYCEGYPETKEYYYADCTISLGQTLKKQYGTWGGNFP